MAREWTAAMQDGRSGSVRDFVAVGDVEIKVIGADGQILDSEVPVRQILEQLVAKTGLPPFMLGLSWASTERMSKQQADLLTSELWSIRRCVEPILYRICRTWLRLEGYGCEPEIVWDDISTGSGGGSARGALSQTGGKNQKGNGGRSMKIQKQASVLTAGTPDAEQLEKINRQAKSPLKAEEVYVFSVRLCDDRPDRDHERCSTEALKALAPMFVGKTGIVDHAWSSEKQVARIFEAGVEYGDGCTFLKAWAYILRGEKTQEIIREIEAGIKKEVSVGCAMRRSICSICGADYGSCEHRKGESYGGQTCVAVLCEPEDAYEFSFVAVPAQKQAGVLKRLGGGGEMPAAELERLKKEAALGREYRKELEERFVRAAMLLELGLKEPVLREMAAALEAAQLKQAGCALEKKTAKLYPPQTQLSSVKETALKTDSAFLI